MSCSDSELVSVIRKAMVCLDETDRQLELIQSGQLKLRLEGGRK